MELPDGVALFSLNHCSMQASLPYSGTSRKRKPITVYLLHIVHDTEEIPLYIHLALPPERKPIKLVVDEMIQGVFKGAGEDLFLEMDGDEFDLSV